MAEGAAEDNTHNQENGQDSSTAKTTENEPMEKTNGASKENGELKDVVSESPSINDSEDGKKKCRVEYVYICIAFILGAGLLGVMIYFTVLNTTAQRAEIINEQPGDKGDQNAVIGPKEAETTTTLRTTITTMAVNSGPGIAVHSRLNILDGQSGTSNGQSGTSNGKSATSNLLGGLGNVGSGDTSSGTSNVQGGASNGNNGVAVHAAAAITTKVPTTARTTTASATSGAITSGATTGGATTTTPKSTPTTSSLFLPGGGIPRSFLRGGIFRP